MCCHLTFQTLLQPVKMAHPQNLSHPSRVRSAIFRMQVAEGCASHIDVWLQFIVLYSIQCTVQCTLYCSVQGRCVGCPGTQWDVTVQPVKTRPKFHCQNKSYVRHKLVAYFSHLVKERKLTGGQNIRGMFYTATNWKTKAVQKMACKIDQ